MDLFSDYTPPMTVAKAIRLSWASLVNTSVLIRLVLPVLFALCFFISILFWGWPLIATKFVPYLQSFSILQSVFGQLDLWLGFSLLSVFALLIFTVLIFTVSYFFLIILTSLFLVPLLNPIIRKLYFPNLTENSELTLFDSLKNSVVSITIYFGLLIVFSPILIFVPLGQVLVPYFLNAHLTRRVFPYDVLQSYATASEFKHFMLNEKQSLWSLALLTGGYFYVPILNLLAAPLAALAFVIFSMGKISDYRR
jgi:hypothetical protein